jgi:phenylacetic acid degradation operon negative regulatory protein
MYVFTTHKMGKLLRISDYLLLIAAATGDVLQEINLGFGLRPAILKSHYGFAPSGFKKANYYTAVSKMIAVGDISKKIDNQGQPYLELTGKGSIKFKRKFPLLSLKRKTWDGSFMVVVFDIPEVQRKDRYIVRKKLEALGFAMLQESVWISPYHFEEDLREFFADSGMTSQVMVLKAQELGSGSNSKLVGKVWKVDVMNNNYQQIVDECRKIRTLPDAEKTNAVKNIINLYIETIKTDPFLPDELINTNKLRIEAGEALSALNK